MRAAQRTRYGLADVITVDDVPRPVPGPGQVVVAVHASSVSRTDCALMAARPFIMRFMTGLFGPRSPRLGTDFAGVVAACGAGVTRFAVGDRVWGIEDLGCGSHAECVLLEETAHFAKMPDEVSFDDGAACIEGGWYAESILDRVPVTSSSRVLVNGATGAIGSALLQLCVHAGAAVTAVGPSSKADLLQSLGATEVVCFDRADFTQLDARFDLVVDAVGKSRFSACRRLLTDKGIFVSSELGPGMENLLLAATSPVRPGHRVVFPIPMDHDRFLARYATLWREGCFRGVIDRTVGLDEIQEAYRYVDAGLKTGSVIVRPSAN